MTLWHDHFGMTCFVVALFGIANFGADLFCAYFMKTIFLVHFGTDLFGTYFVKTIFLLLFLFRNF